MSRSAAGQPRSRAITVMRRAYRSPRSPDVSVARRRPSRRTCITRRMLTKDLRIGPRANAGLGATARSVRRDAAPRDRRHRCCEIRSGKRGAASRRSAGGNRRLFGAHTSATRGRPRPAVDAATATVAKHSEARAAARAEAVVPRSVPARLDVGDCDSAPGLLGGRFGASTITCCVAKGRTGGPPRPRSPGCRLARRSGHLVPAGTRAAPYRPHQERDRDRPALP